MAIERVGERSFDRPLRLWPGVVAVALQWLIRFGTVYIAPEAIAFAVFGSLILGLVILIWWAFFSRARPVERIIAIVLMAIGLATTPLALHKSIAEGLMGWMFLIYAVPFLCLALVLWAVASRRLSPPLRLPTLVAAILAVFTGWTLLRTEGITGSLNSELTWRWKPTAEERLLTEAVNPQVALPTTATPVAAVTETPATVSIPEAPPAAVAPAAITPANTTPEWPGFRGPNRGSVVRGVRIATDWSSTPPVELWRRPIGPGWSSFAVDGDLVYTQEQRGEEEIVACYNRQTGKPVWAHRDKARFWESNAGAGPRSTPTLSRGRVYSFGATGIVNALDARTGAVIWSRNAATDTEVDIPGWGFASSPLVIDDVVIIAAAGRLIGYDAATGNPRWKGPADSAGYSSPHLISVDGVPQVLLMNGKGTISIAPKDGAMLWEYPWPKGHPIVQPAVASGSDLLVSTSEGAGGTGTRRVSITRASSGWNVEERWTSNGLKPYYNHFVIHNGHAFGFDGSILSCIDLADGKRKWKGGRYGFGQLLLLADQDLLLVLSEEGELALVQAGVDNFKELARMPAIEGKTWNHPVLVGDTLLVRNGQEMAAFRLPKERR